MTMPWHSHSPAYMWHACSQLFLNKCAVLCCAARLPLPETGLCAGPAMVCVLSPPSSLSAAATAPAGVSPAVAALLYSQQDSSSTRDQDKACSDTDKLKAAHMWACLPLLLVDAVQAEQELTQLFTAMCGELQHQAAAMAADDRASATPAQQEPFPQGLSSSYSMTSSSSSSSAQQAYTQHWKPLLWDWLYAVQGADASCAPGCIPQVAEQFRTSAKHPAATAEGRLYERAAIYTMDDAPGSSSSSSNKAAALASKHAITKHLLELLVGHELWAAVQQLQAAVVREAALAVAGNGHASPTSAGGSDDYSAALALSPRVSSRHDSCESYNQYGTARTMQGYRPPLHCRDMLVPPRLSSREQQLQQQQQKYIHSLEFPEHARTPLCQPQQQQEDGGESEQQQGCSPRGQGRQPPARRASASSAAVMSSGGLFDTQRRLSLDSLPLPYHPSAVPSELYPPRWSVDLPPTAHTALHQLPHHQHHQQQVFFPPSALMAAGLHTTTSPATAAMGPLGPGHHSMLASPLSPAAAAAAAAAASGAAAAQAALMTHLYPGSSFNSPASSLQSPAVRHPGPGSISRYPPHASPSSFGASLAPHLHPQHPLGYSPSLGSSNSVATSVFVTADTPVGATGGYAGMPGPHGLQGRGSAGGPQLAGGAGGGVDPSVEGRHWAVFDTTGLEGFDQGEGSPLVVGCVRGMMNWAEGRDELFV